MPQNLQFVWPKDGNKGRSGHRGFFGRLNNILTNRGPDVFLQEKGSNEPIKPDFWGNWDSYHFKGYHNMEENGPYVSRGFQRYDPHTRRYKTWSAPHDWYGYGVNDLGEGLYPRFTRSEWRKMASRLDSGKTVNPARMGEGWNDFGPKKFRPEHDWFWQRAHRVGENFREGFHPLSTINPFLIMHQENYSDLQDWMIDEQLHPRWRPRQYRGF